MDEPGGHLSRAGGASRSHEIHVDRAINHPQARNALRYQGANQS